jgi:integrase
VERPAAKAANATIRNELAALRRMFTLAIQASKIAQAPHVPSLRVSNSRSGFFEMEHFLAVLKHLPVDLRPVVEFAYLTGWRRSEILGLEWRNVDFRAGEVRLDPGATKNGEARTFPFSAYPPLGELLKWQRKRTVAVEKKIKRIVATCSTATGGPSSTSVALGRRRMKRPGFAVVSSTTSGEWPFATSNAPGFPARSR